MMYAVFCQWKVTRANKTTRSKLSLSQTDDGPRDASWNLVHCTLYAQLYEKSHLERLVTLWMTLKVTQGHLNCQSWDKVIGNGSMRQITYHFPLVFIYRPVCLHPLSFLRCSEILVANFPILLVFGDPVHWVDPIGISSSALRWEN